MASSQGPERMNRPFKTVGRVELAASRTRAQNHASCVGENGGILAKKSVVWKEPG